MFSRDSLKASMPATAMLLCMGLFSIFWLGEGPAQSVFAFAALKLRRTPRFVLQAPRGRATRSPKGEAWWARQRPYKAAFPEGFRGLIERLNRRVPTKIPTKLPRGRRLVCRPYAQSSAALRSNYQGSLMAISLENILEVDPGTRRPMADRTVR